MTPDATTEQLRSALNSYINSENSTNTTQQNGSDNSTESSNESQGTSSAPSNRSPEYIGMRKREVLDLIDNCNKSAADLDLQIDGSLYYGLVQDRKLIKE